MMDLDNYFLSTHHPSLDNWDSHSFGVGVLDEQHMPLVMDVTTMESPASSEASTGYLQDAVVDWSDRCKRRRVVLFPHDQARDELEDLLQGFWNSNCYGDQFANLSYMIQENNIISGEPFISIPFKEINIQEMGLPQPELLSSPSSSSYKDLVSKDPSVAKDTHESRDSQFSHHSSSTLRAPFLKDEESRSYKKKKKKKAMGLVYPFAVVKPGGLDGDVTLADINERVLMRPTRPVRHPVGEFACVPCVSANGPGLSGKTIVGFTRIHTQGRGTITIIRTRG